MTYREAYAIKLLRTRACWFGWLTEAAKLATRGFWTWTATSAGWTSPDTVCKRAGHSIDHLPKFK